MKNHLFFITLMFFVSDISAQNIFSEISLKKKVYEKSVWEVNIDSRWRKLYGNPSENRLELSGEGRYHSGQWQLRAGLRNFLTFNEVASNLYELRPYIGVNFKVPFTQQINFVQLMRVEWRNYFYSNTTQNIKSVIRTRIRVGLSWDLPSKKENRSWKLIPEYEILSNTNDDEISQFKSSDQFRLSLGKTLKSGHQFFIRYIKSNTYNNQSEIDKYVHIIRLDYRF